MKRETPETFATFQRWLAAGCPVYRDFAAAEGRTESAIAHLAQRNRWQDRAKEKGRQDAIDGFGDPEEDAVRIERAAMRMVRDALLRCAEARLRLSKKAADWELNPQVTTASAAVAAEELNAVRMLRILRRGSHGGDRTGQHGPGEDPEGPDGADVEFERASMRDRGLEPGDARLRRLGA